LRRLVYETWVNVQMQCVNGRVAVFSEALSCCLGANNNPVHTGAGATAKSAGVYAAKYLKKDQHALRLLASVMTKAYQDAQAYGSTAPDAQTDPAGRFSKNFAQKIINRTGGERPPWTTEPPRASRVPS
jgi:hypothetical protein